MTVSMHPDITCTRCGTVVPWGPYCPHCVAYLEFAGEPPWSPDAPVEEPPATIVVEQTVPSQIVPSQTVPNQQAPGDVLELTSKPSQGVESESEATKPEEPRDFTVFPDNPPVTRPTSPQQTQETTREPSGPRRIPWHQPTPTQRRGYIAAGLLSGLIVLVIAVLAGWSSLLVTIPVIMGWALASGLLFFVEFEHEEVHEEHVSEAAVDGAPVEEAGGLEARAPQLVDAVVVKTRGPTIARATMGDTPCATCGKPNSATRRYCDWCGGVMEGATVAPSTVAVVATPEEEKKPGKGKKRRGRRSPNRSWRQPLMAGGVVVIVMSTLLIAFFGPGALRWRGGITTVYRQISQWLDPYTGDPQDIESVTSTSTLPGTSADLIASSDVRTFWASDTTPGFGIGTVLTYTLADNTPINRLVIFPGIQGPQFDTRALATPKDITLTFDDGTSATAVLQPVDDQQALRQLVEFPSVGTQTVALTINSVYPPLGAREGDIGEVAISGTEFLKVPAPPPLIGIQDGPREPKLPGIPRSTGG